MCPIAQGGGCLQVPLTSWFVEPLCCLRDLGMSKATLVENTRIQEIHFSWSNCSFPIFKAILWFNFIQLPDCFDHESLHHALKGSDSNFTAKHYLRQWEIPINLAKVTPLTSQDTHPGFQINGSSITVFTLPKWPLQIVGESRFWFPFTAKREQTPLGCSAAQGLISGPCTLAVTHCQWMKAQDCCSQYKQLDLLKKRYGLEKQEEARCIGFISSARPTGRIRGWCLRLLLALGK